MKSAGEFTVSAIHYPVRPMDPSGVVCVSGAGDCFAAAFISSALRAATQDEAVAAGIQVLKGDHLYLGWNAGNSFCRVWSD